MYVVPTPRIAVNWLKSVAYVTIPSRSPTPYAPDPPAEVAPNTRLWVLTAVVSSAINSPKERLQAKKANKNVANSTAVATQLQALKSNVADKCGMHLPVLFQHRKIDIGGNVA